MAYLLNKRMNELIHDSDIEPEECFLRELEPDVI